jgi:hypothetical protein
MSKISEILNLNKSNEPLRCELEFILDKLSDSQKIELENTLIYNKLSEIQGIGLMHVYYLYSNLDIKDKSFHKEKFDTYKMPYFVENIKKGKTPLEIMNRIITECEEYSLKKIFQKMQGSLLETKDKN